MGDPDAPRVAGSGPPAPGETCREVQPALRAPPRPAGLDTGVKLDYAISLPRRVTEESV